VAQSLLPVPVRAGQRQTYSWTAGFLACDKCLSLRYHEPSKQAVHSVEREVVLSSQLFFFVRKHCFFSPKQPLLFRQLTSLLRYPFRDRPRERMRLRARAKWVPAHGVGILGEIDAWKIVTQRRRHVATLVHPEGERMRTGPKMCQCCAFLGKEAGRVVSKSVRPGRTQTIRMFGSRISEGDDKFQRRDAACCVSLAD
jgi:hypothetical protein